MNVGLITSEFPPEIDYGGIATYMKQLSQPLTNRGHHIEVFTISQNGEGKYYEDNITVNRIRKNTNESLEEIKLKIANVFSKRHKEILFIDNIKFV